MTDYAALFHSLADYSQYVYFAYHPASRKITYVSPAYERVLGGDCTQVNAELDQWLQLLHPDDWEHLQAQVAMLTAGQSVAEDIELRLRHPDGRRQWLCLTLCRSTATAGDLLLAGTMHDITRVKEYMSNADKFNAKKNATLEILSHDLSGPLLVVQQLAEHVAEQAKSYSNPALNELVRLMRTTCQNSVDLIRDFVNQEFLESANVELNLSRVNLVARLRLLLDNYQNAQHLLDKRIRYVPDTEKIYVYIDENKFQQVINNLLSNALKFTPDGGRIEVRVEQHQGRARIVVQDTGIGIPAKLQPMLFDKFTKARRQGLRGERTIGLGMSVIRTLVMLHDGHISFTSEEGQGTTFTIELPVVADEQPVPEPTTPPGH